MLKLNSSYQQNRIGAMSFQAPQFVSI